MNHNSIREISELLVARKLAPKKRWGQNFLVAPHVRSKIIDLCGAGAGSRLWEIGPGLGALTDEFVASGAEITVFEVDHGIVRLLQERYGADVRVVAGDAVETLGVEIGTGPPPDIVAGNLPYRSASAIVAQLCELGVAPPKMVFMVQRELAERFCALPGRSDYSALTILVQSRFVVTEVFAVPGSAFYPPPRVASSVVTFSPHADLPSGEVLREASLIARALFSQRRKTCRTVLRHLMHKPGKEAFARRVFASADVAGIDLTLRAEAIPVGDFLTWAHRTVTER